MLNLLIRSDGTITANDKDFSPAGIESFIKENLNNNQYLIIVVNAEPKVSYGDFVMLLNTLRLADAKRVVI